MRASANALVVMLCGAAVTGCAVGAGSASPAASTPATRPSPVPTAVRQAARTHEVASPPPRLERASRTAPTPAEAVRAYAERYINWDAGTVTGMLRDLSGASVGQARSAMALEAAQVASDPELAQNGIANSGTVEAVAPLAGNARRWVVVTRERTTAALSSAYQGLRPGWHITLAGVTATARGWVVSDWQPEN
jgi:hypothetical protein